MIIQFDKARCTQDDGEVWICLRANLPALARQFVGQMQDCLYDADIKQHRQKRSIDANAYLWVLCQKIAEAVKGITKETVYQDAVKHAGQLEVLTLRNDAVTTFIHKWSAHGLGWFAEPIEGSDEDYTQVIAYYGSSVYSTSEMAFLLGYIINIAKDLGLETLPPDEIERIKSLWATKDAAGSAEQTEQQTR